MAHFAIPMFSSVDEFLYQLAVKRNKVTKGGVPDRLASARMLLQDWNAGKVPFFTAPPPDKERVVGEATIVPEWSKVRAVSAHWPLFMCRANMRPSFCLDLSACLHGFSSVPACWWLVCVVLRRDARLCLNNGCGARLAQEFNLDDVVLSSEAALLDTVASKVRHLFRGRSLHRCGCRLGVLDVLYRVSAAAAALQSGAGFVDMEVGDSNAALARNAAAYLASTTLDESGNVVGDDDDDDDDDVDFDDDEEEDDEDDSDLDGADCAMLGSPRFAVVVLHVCLCLYNSCADEDMEDDEEDDDEGDDAGSAPTTGGAGGSDEYNFASDFKY